MISPRGSSLGRLLTAVVSVVVVVAGLRLASPASATEVDASVCDGPDRYLVLVDPTGVANQALCRTQERVLKSLSEDQWGIAYTPDQRNRMLRWGRKDAIAAMYLEVLRIAQEEPAERTADEATVYTWLQQTLAALRTRMANGAYAEQIAWSNDPCNYVGPTPGSTASGCTDPGSLTTLFGQPPGPTYEQFVSYGAQRVLSEEFDGDDLALVAATSRSVQNQLIGAAAGAAGGAALGGGLAAAASAGAVYSAATWTTASATAAAGAAGAAAATAAAVAGSVFIVVVAVVLAVVRGIQVFDQAKIPDQLRADIETAKQPVDVANWVGDDSSRATLVLDALATRINTAAPPSADVPSAPAPDAPGFLVQSGVDDTAFTQQLRFRSPVNPDGFFTAWLDHGWWIVADDQGGRAMSRDLVYVDHAGARRSASPTVDGFRITTLGVGGSTDCTAANGCEDSTALQILTPPPTATDPLKSTATLADTPIVFTQLPADIAASYAVGDEIDDQTFSAQASYLTTMSYRWELTRHSGTGDQTKRVEDNEVNWTFTIPGDYRLSVIATASSGESARHDWDFTVTGDAAGQFASGILVTQYPTDGATPGDEQGPWIEGSTLGTICVSTDGTDATDFSLQFAGEPVQKADGVTAGYACFPRPASAHRAGVQALASVSACKVSATLCIPPTGIDYVDGTWVQRSPFSYTIQNEPPSAGTIRQGVAGGALSTTVPSKPSHFSVGQTVEARTTVSDAGGGSLTVHVRWSDGTGQTLTDVPSGQVIDVSHSYAHASWGPIGVQIQAVDDNGETGNLATGFFVVQPQPASIDLDASADATGLVTVTGHYTDPDHSASGLAIDWGDDTTDGFEAPFPAPLGTGSTSTVDPTDSFAATHRYATGGTHHVRATVYNGAPTAGTADEAVTIPNAAPVIVADDPLTVGDDGEVSLQVLVGDLTPGDQLTLHADYGDGSTDRITGKASGDTVTVHHRYTNGRYLLALTATDAAGATSEPLTHRLLVDASGTTLIPDVLPDTSEDFDGLPHGDVAGPTRAAPGAKIKVSVGAGATSGDQVTAWLYSAPTKIGSFTVGATGTGTLTIPDTTVTGSHVIALTTGERLLGWFPITIATVPDGGDGSGGDHGSGSQTGGHDDAGSPGDHENPAQGSPGDSGPAKHVRSPQGPSEAAAPGTNEPIDDSSPDLSGSHDDNGPSSAALPTATPSATPSTGVPTGTPAATPASPTSPEATGHSQSHGPLIAGSALAAALLIALGALLVLARRRRHLGRPR